MLFRYRRSYKKDRKKMETTFTKDGRKKFSRFRGKMIWVTSTYIQNRSFWRFKKSRLFIVLFKYVVEQDLEFYSKILGLTENADTYLIANGNIKNVNKSI